MYLEHFGLREFPFSLAPDPRFLYLSAQHREALAHLLYGVRTEGGFVQLTGEVGTGKTTVCRCFLEQLPPGTRVAVILTPGPTAEELLASVCDEFEILRPAGPASVKESLDRISRFLLDVHAAGERAVLVIDEAQTLDADVLEQVRLLTNIETSRHKLLQIILMGQPELRATLSRPDLRQLAQRITARFHLRPLSRKETQEYVRHRIEVAGGGEELFPPEVIGRLRRLSRGVPRLINVLCDRSLLGAFAQGKRQVDGATLSQAAREVAGRSEWSGTQLRYAAAAAGAAGVIMIALVLLVPHGWRSPERSPAAAVSSPVAPRAPAISGVLRALLEQPEAQRQEEAWRALFRLWGINAREGENGCAQALAHGLDCVRGEGGLEQLSRMNRPAIVRVDDAQGQPRWLVVERLQGRQVTFSAGGARTVVNVDAQTGQGITQFALLWRPPARTRGMLAAGDRGSGVAWLAQRLVAAGAMVGAVAADPVYDETITEAVRSFQRSQGMNPDGIAGPETLMLLDGESAPGTPTLAGAG